MRVLGDEYVKGEFRAHREVENPMHIVSLCCFLLRFWGKGGGGGEDWMGGMEEDWRWEREGWREVEEWENSE